MEDDNRYQPSEEIFSLEVPTSQQIVASDDEDVEPSRLPYINGFREPPSDDDDDEISRLRKELEQLKTTHHKVLTENAELRHRLVNVVEAKETESKTNDSDALQTRIAELEAEVSRQSDIVSQVDAERRQSVQEITEMNQKMFKHIVEAEKQASETKEQDALTMAELRQQVETLTSMLDSEQDRSRAIDRQRAGSIKFLSNQRLKDLIEAESEFMAEIENWKKRVADLEEKVSEYQRRELEANESETKEEEVNEVTPGGPNEEEYLLIIAKLQEQLSYSNQSKIELLQSTNGEIDQLRHDLLLIGRENMNASEVSDTQANLLGWMPKPW